MTIRLSLPLVLRLDAITCAASGVLLVSAASSFAELTGLSETLLRAVGLAFLPFAALVFMVARDPRSSLVRTVAWSNFIYVAASLGVVFRGGLTGLGIVLVLAVAAVVEAFGTLELLGLARSGRIPVS